MANIDGLPVNSAVTHAEFMSRTEDTSTTGAVNFQNVTESTSPTTGAIKTAGGLGVEKSLNVGLDAEIGGTLTVQTNLDVNGVATIVGILNTNDIAASGNINTTFDMSANNILAIGNVEAQTEMITPLITATTADVGTLNLTNAFTAPSLTVTADATIHGNLTVNGTTVTLNTATVDSEDPNITINKTGNDASSEGAGLTIDRTGTKGSLQYANALASKFKIGDLASESEVVTVSHTQTLTNKTLTSPVLTTPSTDIISATEQGSTPATPASGVRKLYPKADGFYQLDSTGLETKVGSGSGGGGVLNLITNGSADDAITSIFTPYADAAGTRPVDGTGGSPTVTTSISAVSPLTGTKSYLLTKPASNTQGEGWSTPATTLDLSFRAKALKISVDYIVNSGTFVSGSRTTDSDIIWSCYDITNSKIVEPSNIKMFASSTTISEKFEATVQFDYNCTSFRLIAHVATSSSSAYEIKVDNVTVSPSVYVYGTPITDMASVSTVTLSSGTNVNLSQHFQRREGDHIRQRGYITWNGAGSGGTFTVSLGGYTIDTNKINSSTQNSIEGYAMWLDNGTARKAVGVMYSTTTAIQFEELTSSSGVLVGTGFASGDTLSYEIVVPVVGLSSSVQMSDSADTRQFVVNAFTGAIALAAGATIPLATVRKDTHGAIVGNKIKIQTAGDYTAFALVLSSAATSIRIKKNGGSDKYIGSIVAGGIGGGSVLLPNLIAGDEIEFITEAAATITGSDALMMSLFRSPASSAIAANESVSAAYFNTAGTSLTTSYTTMPYATKDYDSHGAFNGATGTFTAPIAGKYRISIFMTSAVVTLAVGGGGLSFYVQQAGSAATIKYIGSVPGTGGANNYSAAGSTTLNMASGDTFTIKGLSSVATTLATPAGINRIEIEKVG